MITQTQFPFHALIATGLSSLSIFFIVLAGLAILLTGAYFVIKARKVQNPLQG